MKKIDWGWLAFVLLFVAVMLFLVSWKQNHVYPYMSREERAQADEMARLLSSMIDQEIQKNNHSE